MNVAKVHVILVNRVGPSQPSCPTTTQYHCTGLLPAAIAPAAHPNAAGTEHVQSTEPLASFVEQKFETKEGENEAQNAYKTMLKSTCKQESDDNHHVGAAGIESLLQR